MSDFLDFAMFVGSLIGIANFAYRRNMPAAIAYACLAMAMLRILMMKLA